MNPDLANDYAVARETMVATWVERDVVEVTGVDASSYLQGQLSQDVASIDPGASMWSFILQPHGKVDALVRVTRDADRFIIDTDAGFGALVRERLERFKMRVKVETSVLDWRTLAVRGPASSGLEIDGAIAASANWPDIAGVDFMGADFTAPNGIMSSCRQIYEVLRIESGVPRMGCEIDDKTIPGELEMNDLAISFDKGCYTGQELVARIDSRGNRVPRNLRRVSVTFPSEDVPDRGAKVVSADRAVRPARAFGTLSSVAYSPRLCAAVGLCMVRRDVALPADADIVSGDRSMSAVVEAPPR